MFFGLHHIARNRLPGLLAGGLAVLGKGLGCRSGIAAPGSRTCAGLEHRRGRTARALQWAALLLAVFLPLSAPAAAPQQTGLIINVATLTSTETPPFSSSVEVTAAVTARTEATLEFMEYAPKLPDAEPTPVQPTVFSADGSTEGNLVEMPPPLTLNGKNSIPLNAPVPLVPRTLFHRSEPVFLRLADLDQNLDPNNAETVFVTISCPDKGDEEILRLTETGTDTGIFTGYLQTDAQPGNPYNGALSVENKSEIKATYVDAFDQADISISAALIDPFGVVFNSSTGAPVDGATVTLVDDRTDLPALVYGDDGVSMFPSSVVSGGSVTDSGGATYEFPPGEYRFPFVEPGRYRLEISPSLGYAAPSTVPTAALQALPGAAFAIVEPGSRGEPFTLNPGPAINIDIPVDPAAVFWIKKTPAKKVVAAGDFLQYHLAVENIGTIPPAPGVVLTDRLPLGFRYQEGSAKIDGADVPDPAISADGRTLTFRLGDMAKGDIRNVHYVVEVAAGTRPGAATNRAFAEDSAGNTSNLAEATVTVREDLFRSKAILMGRVMIGDCTLDDSEKEGLQGARIYLEDGTFVQTDKEGRYHFEGVAPGVHVVQLDLDSLPPEYEVAPCGENSRFAGRAYSQFIDVQGGTIWRADFHLTPKAPPRGEVSLELFSELHGDRITYRLQLQGAAVPLENLRLTLTLPEGGGYLPGSSRLDGAPLAEPEAKAGALTYRLDDCPGDWGRELTLQVQIRPEAPEELRAQAVLGFDTPTATEQSTPEAVNLAIHDVGQKRRPLPEYILHPRFDTFVAELSGDDKRQLDELIAEIRDFNIAHIFAIGHTDNVRIAPRSRHIYDDNFALSEARAGSVARYLAAALDLSPARITTVGMGETQPVTGNATPGGRAQNRRVEVRFNCEEVEDYRSLQLQQDRSGRLTAGTVGSAPLDQTNTGRRGSANMNASSGEQSEGILSPADGQGLAHQTGSVRVKLNALLKPRLLIDGREVPGDRIGFQKSDLKTGKTLYSYIGVNFGEPGRHTLTIEGLGPFGNARFKESIQVVRTGEIAAIRLAEGPQNLADGLTPVELRLELLDSSGAVVRSPVDLEWREGSLLPLAPDREAVAAPKESRVVHVDSEGRVRFQPVHASGLYRVILAHNDSVLDAETYVKPKLRDWILVGLAEGTLGYNTLSGNMEALDEQGLEEDLYEDGRVAFFAKGQIKGEWLLTLAYDSDKTKEKNKSLHQVIDPDTYYTLYGDGTRQGYEAASGEKLYIKIERDRFYALFGDFDTGLTVTELSRYSRSLTGIKSELHTEHFAFNLFASESSQIFVKDEIRGDGTTGLYRLSRSNIVLNSEKITIETRDRFRSELTLSSETLSRHIDYDIDYDAGTLFFKLPVPSKDVNFNPIFIVVEYESNDPDNEHYNYGGRGAVKLLDQNLEVGATYVHEDQAQRESDLYGLDATLKLGENTRLRGEVAMTNKDLVRHSENKVAYLAELAHSSDRLDAKIYVREQGADFGLGQQNGSESGTWKYGADAAYRLSEKWSLSGQAYRQINLSTDAEREVFEAETRYALGGFNLDLGLRQATDVTGDGNTNRSHQVTAGGGWRTLDDRLTLRVDHEQSLASSDENANFPTRTILGADYRLTEAVSLFAAQEFTWGELEDSQGTRVGLKATPWSGGEVNTSLEQQIDENGARVFALFGAKQSWQVTERWSLDAGLDRSQTMKHPGNPRFSVNIPPPSGSTNDFTAVSLGATYKEERWSWSNRVEFRDSDNEDKWGLFSGIVGEPREGLGLSARAQLFKSNAASGAESTDGEIRLGLAHRPKFSRWIVLDRLDYLFEREKSSTSGFNNWRLVNNLNANYKLNRRTQIALQYGVKYVQENIDGKSYDGFTDLIGVEGRYDINKRWDIGLRTSVLHSWNSKQVDYGAGASLGYNVMQNAWVSLGYNVLGFEDRDFSRADFTAQGPFLRFRIKFDQDSLRKAAQGLL